MQVISVLIDRALRLCLARADGRRLVLARYDDAVSIYDAATGTEVLHKSIPTQRVILGVGIRF